MLESSVQVGSPHLMKYKNLIEGVQRRATKLVPELKNLPYKERLKKLKLTTLVERRVRGDMIETYKLITRKESVDPGKFFQMKNVRTGDRVNMIKMKRYNRNNRKYYYTQRVIPVWNVLSREEVTANKTSDFKKIYDKKEKERQEDRRDDIYEWY